MSQMTLNLDLKNRLAKVLKKPPQKDEAQLALLALDNQENDTVSQDAAAETERRKRIRLSVAAYAYELAIRFIRLTLIGHHSHDLESDYVFLRHVPTVA